MDYYSRKMEEVDLLKLNILKLGEAGSKEINDTLILMLRLMSQGKDITSVAGDVIKLLAISDLPFKKVIYSYLIRYTVDLSNLNIMASNILLKEFCDPNPHLRRLAFKTLCNITCLKDQSLQILPQALKDNSSYVRRTVTLCCPQLTRHYNICSNPFVDLLYEKIRDSEQSIIINSLMSLNEILVSQGGIVINFKLFEYLLSKLPIFEEWNWHTVCEVLKKYEAKCDSEVFFTLNLLDDHLMERNPLVFVPCLELALSLVRFKHENLQKDIIEQALVALRQSLITSTSEVTYSILELYEKLIPLCKNKLSTVHKQLLCRYSDPPFVKVKKLLILPCILNDSNDSEICEEILLHCIDSHKEVRKQAIKSIICMLKSTLSLNLQCIEVLVQFMELNYHDLTEGIIKVFSSINLAEMEEETKSHIFVSISKHFNKIRSESGKIALLWCVGNYGAFIEQSPYIIETIFKEVKGSESQQTMTALLVASVKLFFIRPAQMQLLLGEIFETAKQSSIPLIKNQVCFYHKLLRIDAKIAKTLLECDHYLYSDFNVK